MTWHTPGVGASKKFSVGGVAPLSLELGVGLALEHQKNFSVGGVAPVFRNQRPIFQSSLFTDGQYISLALMPCKKQIRYGEEDGKNKPE